MTIEEQILEAMGRWVSKKRGYTVEVTSYYESYSEGSCGYGTCDYSDYEVTMYYTNPDGSKASTDYNGELSALIRELT